MAKDDSLKSDQTDEHYLNQIAGLKNELYLEKELVKKLKQTQEDWSDLIEKVQPTIQALSEKIKELKTNLHLKNQELSNVLQSLSNGLIVTDLKGKIQTFNRAAITLTEISKENATDSQLNSLLKFDILPFKNDEIDLELIKTGHPQQFSLNIGKDKTVLIKSNTTLMTSEENESQGIIINLVDVTKLRQLEEEAERRNRMTAMGEIAMQVAHELRNPLGSIELFLSMMRQDLDEESETMSLANHIGSATRSMNHIISNLLEYTNPRPIVLDEFDIGELAADFIDFSAFSAQQQNIEIELENLADSSRVLGNKDLIRQVFHNLYVNAYQAMPEGGVLKISIDNYSESDPVILKRIKKQSTNNCLNLLKVTFSDNGKGMSEKIKKRIFDPFFTTREQGTGLGLSIVHNTMGSHGGTILVNSKENEGTSIHLLFPVPDLNDSGDS